MPQRLFLDLAASLPPSPSASQALSDAALHASANPAAPHREGKLARASLDAARQTFHNLLSLPATGQIIFTSGGTEAAHLALHGILAKARPAKTRIVATAVEHPAILAAARSFAGPDNVDLVPCRPDGTIDPLSVIERLNDQTALLACQAANLDSGAIHPLPALAPHLAARLIPWLCDAQALFALQPFPWSDLRPDFIILSSHRFGGPKGCGLLAAQHPSRLAPLLLGGRQEHGLRAGTENLPGIAAAAAAAKEATAHAETRAQSLRETQRQLLRLIRATIPGTQLLGPEPGPDRIPGHLALTFDHVDAESLAFILDLRGIAIGVGSGCLSTHEKVSHVFTAMGLSPRQALGAVLLGLPPGLQPDDLSRIVTELSRAVARIRQDQPNIKP